MDDREVFVDGGLEQPVPNAAPREDLLGEHGAAQQETRLQSDDRGDRKHRVAKYVPVVDPLAGEALGPSRADIVLGKNLEDRRSCDASHNRQRPAI